MTHLGSRGLRIEVDGVSEAIALADWLRRADVVRAEEVIPGARSVILDGVTDPAAAVSALRTWGASLAAGNDTQAGPLVEVPVTYDGTDLADVARRWDVSIPGVVEVMSRVELVSAFCGFAPGFAYLSGLPEHLAVPRLDTPRPRIPAGSVALADAWCGIYPTASPGGWRIIGRTALTLWDDRTDPPAVLAPGTRVRLVAT